LFKVSKNNTNELLLNINNLDKYDIEDFLAFAKTPIISWHGQNKLLQLYNN